MSQLNRFVSAKVCAASLLMGFAIGGCQPAPAPAPYPTTPSAPAPPPAPAEMIPAGATLLSEGSYSSILFKVPDEQGMIFIVDKDTQEIKGRTNAATPGESMTMADLKNVTQPLDSTHSYKIWFVPSVATTKPVAP